MYPSRAPPAPDGNGSPGGGDGRNDGSDSNGIDGDRRRVLRLGATALCVGSAGCSGSAGEGNRTDRASPRPPTVTNTSVSETTAFVGEPIEVRATVGNESDREDTLYAELRVDRMIVDTKGVTVAAGDTASVTFTRAFDTPGEYRLSVNDAAAGTVTVERRPAAFEVETAPLPGSVRVGTPIEVTARIANVGGQRGSFRAELRVDETVVDTREVTLAPGEAASVTFAHAFERPGEYRLGVNDAAAGTVTAERPPSFEVGNTLLEETKVATGEDVAVVATVSNVGGQQGSFRAELERGGETIAARTVTVAPGEDATVRFAVRFETPGAYPLSVSGAAVDTLYVVACSTIVDETVTVGSRSSRTYHRRLKERAEMTIAVTARSGVKPTLSVVGPSGEPVVDGVSGGSIRESFTAARAGRYRIELENDALLPLRNGTWDVDIEVCTW